MYRTKHLNHWPKNAQIFYDDGIKVPMIFGTGKGTYDLGYLVPPYEIEGNRIALQINADSHGKVTQR